MHSRRIFLQTSAAALSAVMSVNRGFAARLTSGRSKPIDAIVFDERLEPCREFADEALRHGADALSIRGNVAEIWFGDLRERLRSGPGIIAGLTLESAALEMRSLARDIEYHEIFRGDHLITDESARHRINTSASLATSAAQISDSVTSLGRSVAQLVAEVDMQTKLRDRKTVRTDVHTRSDDHRRLVSWVIAPIYSQEHKS